MKRPKLQIAVRNLQHKIDIDVDELEEFAQKAVKLCLALPKEKPTHLARLPEVSVLIVTDRQIASLHEKFMNESGPTDVITFQHGEIFISAEMAKRNARRFENPLSSELCLYIVHGLLHMHGFDDRDAASARKMEAVQGRILAKAMV